MRWNYLLGALALACGGGGSGPVDSGARVASVSVAPGAGIVAVRATLAVTATPLALSGQPLSGLAVSWSSSSPAVATVSDGGVVTGVSVGQTTITATVSGIAGSLGVRVTPGSIKLGTPVVAVDLGATRQLQAAVLDALGGVMASEPIAWSSSNPAVASVNSTGMVTASTTGTATITVSSGGVSATVTVTVLVSLNDYGFSDVLPTVQFGTIGGGWQVAYNTFGLGSRVSDASAPVSPPYVMQVKYAAGYVGGGAPATAYIPIPGSPNAFYTRFAWKVSSPWQGHTSNVNKVAFFKLGTNDQLALVMYGPPGGPYYLDVAPEFVGINPSYYRHLPGSPDVALGQWHIVEVLVNRISGAVQWWLDGTLIGNVTMPFTGVPFTEFQLSPTWGGLGDTKVRDDYYWFDHIHLSAAR